jgi:hypothetical protein
MSATFVPPAQGEGCVLLPVRRSFYVIGWILVVLVPPLVLLLQPSGEPTNRYEAAYPLVVLWAPIMSLWGAWRLVRSDLRLRLDPAGVTVPAFWNSRTQLVRWDLLDSVDIHHGPRPELRLVHRTPAGPATTTVVDLRVMAWHEGLLQEVLLHFAHHPRDRAALTDLRALDRFLDRAAGSPRR